MSAGGIYGTQLPGDWSGLTSQQPTNQSMIGKLGKIRSTGETAYYIGRSPYADEIVVRTTKGSPSFTILPYDFDFLDPKMLSKLEKAIYNIQD